MMLPAMERLYFGSDSIIYRILPGVVDGGKMVYNASYTGNIAVSDIDGIKIEILEDAIIDINAQHCGAFRPQL